MKIHFDDIIYKLQSQGGISTFWDELTNRIQLAEDICISRTKGRKISRFLPVLSGSDVFHSSYFRTPISYNKNVKTVVTVHDLIYEELMRSDNKLNVFPRGVLSIFLSCRQRSKAIESADAIVCISNTTKKNLLDYYPSLKSRADDINVIFHGISFLRKEVDNNLPSSTRLGDLFREVSKKYVIFVGGRLPYKNFDVALEGFAHSKLHQEKGYSFICTGQPFELEEIALINKLNLSGHVRVLQEATKEELISLYKNSHALLYISSREGFGLPVLEAMSCKCPAIISTCEAVMEVAGDAGIVIDTSDVSSVANAIDLLSEDAIRQSYISKGQIRTLNFDWDKTAREYMNLYYSLTGGSLK
jgi:glycosyltransferase involved in cell wall biosynthesis